ncbi:tetratricopeptide repeat protein [Microbulbifer sediminum]|uniref:tetratricopeptide repeat protein n=1 Tax=Microbulbifer sediminum TaxID=2904250 RepID=UPI001F2EE9DD|nr:tetratricopeptide repeat protein [Microbulbifer sediminum]
MSANNDSEQRQRLKPILELMKAENYESAIPLLKEFVGEFPANEVALGMLAAAYQQLGMTDSSRELFQQILAQNERNALARFHLGMTYFQERSWTEALKIWEPLVDSGEDFAATFYSGICQANLGNKNLAIELLKASGHNMPRNHPLFQQLEKIATELNFSLS